MADPHDGPETKALRELDADQQRIDATLKGPLSPTLESLIRGERHWVARRQRALERKTVSCAALLHAGGEPLTVHLRDVSAMGAGLELGFALDPGARVRLEIVGLPGRPALDAVVRHSSAAGRRAGLEFTGPADEAREIAEKIVRAFAA